MLLYTLFPLWVIIYRFNKRVFIAINTILLIGGVLTVGLLSWHSNLTVGILTFEDYYLYSYQFNKPYTKLVTIACGMFMAIIYLRLLDYRKATLGRKESDYYILHYLKNSKLFTIFLYIYATGMLLFIVSVPLSANADSYSWSKAQNTAYFSLGRLGYCTSMMAWLMIIFLGSGNLVKGLLSQGFWTILSRLTFGAYLIYPMIVGANFYASSQAFFISYQTLIYCMLSNIALCYVFALPLYILIQTPISNVIRLITTKLSKGQDSEETGDKGKL
jgi:hypothetical protein